MDIHAHRLLILDFGSQYTQLIARKVRELGVYCEILPWDMPEEELRAFWRAIEGEAQPAVSGEEGLRALSLAVQIQRRIQQHREMYGS